VLLGMSMLPLLGVGQARTRTAAERIPVGEYGPEFTQRSAGANELLLVTPDSLAEALQKMQQLLARRGYQVAERTPTRLTTRSKQVPPTPGEVVLVRKWFFFQQRKPAPNPAVSFRLRIRAFPLPTGTQLQLIGVYIHEGCVGCVGADECAGMGMQLNFKPPHAPLSAAPGHRAPPVPFGTMWAENCFEEAFDLARQYWPSTLDFVQVHRYTTFGPTAW
jgi:hypothetical protein